MKLENILRLILNESAEVDEVLTDDSTRQKKLFGSGSFHRVYPSKNNPNIVYKIGTEAQVNDWLEDFKSNPELFPKVYRVGYMNIKLPEIWNEFVKGQLKHYKRGDTIRAKYVELEKFNTKKAKYEWGIINKAIINFTKNKFDAQILFTKIGLEDENEKIIFELAKYLKQNNEEYQLQILENFYNLLSKVYEIKPTADVHKDNFGVDKDGHLKMLDI